MSIIAKLHPKKFPNMSGKMAAIVGYILDRTWTNPAIAEMTVTSDNFVLARHVGDIGMNDFIGHLDDLNKNWKNLLDIAGLTPDERAKVEQEFDAKVSQR